MADRGGAPATCSTATATAVALAAAAAGYSAAIVLLPHGGLGALLRGKVALADVGASVRALLEGGGGAVASPAPRARAAAGAPGSDVKMVRGRGVRVKRSAAAPPGPRSPTVDPLSLPP
jgi:hypothetical protein